MYNKIGIFRVRDCPFCGERGGFWYKYVPSNDLYVGYVFCLNCGCRTKEFWTVATLKEVADGDGSQRDENAVRKAVDVWNGRCVDESHNEERGKEC